MTAVSISIDDIKEQFGLEDDPAAWQAILATVSEEFAEHYRTSARGKEAWFLRIGACSHWMRPHQSRWIAAGGFALATGYKDAAGWSNGLPDFDWSVILAFDGKQWNRVRKFSGNRQVVFRVAVPSRTLRHKQAAIHTMWSTSHEFTLYGFRNIDGKWTCLAASDEKKNGRISVGEKIPQGK